MVKSPRKPRVASGQPAALVVFDKSPTSTAALFSMLNSPGSQATRAIAHAWLVEERTPYLIVGSTGGTQPQTLTLGVYNEEDLLGTALPQALQFLSPTVIAGSNCSAIDPDLHAKVSARWEALKALRFSH